MLSPLHKGPTRGLPSLESCMRAGAGGEGQEKAQEEEGGIAWIGKIRPKAGRAEAARGCSTSKPPC